MRREGVRRVCVCVFMWCVTFGGALFGGCSVLVRLSEVNVRHVHSPSLLDLIIVPVSDPHAYHFPPLSVFVPRFTLYSSLLRGNRQWSNFE